VTVVTLEFGHALRVDPHHAGAGMMAEHVPPFQCLDADSVAFVCEAVACSVVQTECTEL
jgi:hypothetical protein